MRVLAFKRRTGFHFLSKFLKLNETRLRNHLPFLSMKINDKDNFILFRKRTFSNVLEGVNSLIFSGGKPLDPHFTVQCL